MLLRRSRQLVTQASQLEELAHHMEQGWEAEVRLVVDAAYPSAKLIRALSDFMPKSRGCRVRLREVLSGVEEVLKDGTADLAISGLDITGYLGSELSTVEFVAVAHADHACINWDASSACRTCRVDADRGARQRPAAAARRWLGAEQRWTVGSLATSVAFVSSGLGFAWLPRHLIGRELAEGVLAAATGPRQHSPAVVLSLH